VQFPAPDDEWKNHLKHVERLTEINKKKVKRCILLVVLCKLERKLHIILVGKQLEKTSLGDPDTDGRIILKYLLLK